VRRGLPQSEERAQEVGRSTAVGDEGGFAPDLDSNEAALKVLSSHPEGRLRARSPGGARARRGGQRVFRDGNYVLQGEKGRRLDATGLVGYYADLCDRYPIVSIEDGLAEDDWAGWKTITEKLDRASSSWRRPVRHQRRASVARDPRRHRQFDPGQAQPDRHAERNARRGGHGPGRRVHRGHLSPSGETEDVTIADLRGRHAGGSDQDRIVCAARTASPSNNQLLRIEEELAKRHAIRDGSLRTLD
jgi:enolase